MVPQYKKGKGGWKFKRLDSDTLGEVSLKSKNYEQAVADITDCLNMRKVCNEWVKFKRLLTLGEVSLESKNYEQVLADITECVTLKKVRASQSSRDKPPCVRYPWRAITMKSLWLASLIASLWERYEGIIMLKTRLALLQVSWRD